MPNFMPGNDDWLKALMAQNQMPQQMPAPQAQPTGWRGLLGNRDLAMALLANSGNSPQKRSFGEILGTSAIQADQMKQAREDDAFKRQYMQAQIQAMQGKAQAQPSSVMEYEYAKQNGFKGSFEEWQNRARAQADPADVATFKYWDSLSPDKKQDMLKLKRNVGSDYTVVDVNGVPTVVYKPAAGGPQMAGGTPLATPLTNLPSQAAGAAAIKQAESQGGAIGAGQGAIIAGIQKKGADAKTVLGTLDIADQIIDKATGSGVGAATDKAAGFFGKSTEGAQATAQLQVLQAGLMLNMPRMEGPQSDRDVELYRQAAASLGDPTVPNAQKKAAIAVIRRIQQQYADRAGVDTAKGPAVGTIKGGYRFKGGNPADKNSWEPVK